MFLCQKLISLISKTQNDVFAISMLFVIYSREKSIKFNQ